MPSIQPCYIMSLVVASVAMLTAFAPAVTACSCAPPPPPPPGTQPALRLPSLKGKNSAVFVGLVEEVFPGSLGDYERRWERMYGQPISEDRPPSVDRVRSFILQLWPGVFSPREKEGFATAKSLEALESAVNRFWLMPRRIRLMVEEGFAGPRPRRFVLYTGLSGGDCGISFEVGQRWLVDAYLDEAGRWIAHQCSVTIPLAGAEAVLKALRDGSR